MDEITITIKQPPFGNDFVAEWAEPEGAGRFTAEGKNLRQLTEMIMSAATEYFHSKGMEVPRKIHLRFEPNIEIPIGPNKQTIESLQKDIDTGNTYRIESLKQMLTLAAALLAFTVSFRPILHNVEIEPLIYVSWVSLGVSVVTGIGVMMCWERFYLSYRLNWHGNPKEGEEKRKRLTFWRRRLLLAQAITFSVGVIGVAVFAGKNFKNVIVPADAAGGTVAPSSATPTPAVQKP